ncbi:hypothetical protein KJ840_02300 [Patescibacteria group bacterium]|nr:hypothetical protein [Patescibacteria group bacterium]
MLENWSINQNESGGLQVPLLPPIYKGASFNPETFNRGIRSEWLVILDLFALMRQVVEDQSRELQPIQFAIMDAGLYWVVNLLEERGINLSSKNPDKAAKEFIDIIIGACQEPRFSSEVKTNQTRNAYLRAIAKQFPANYAPPVFGLMDVWTDLDFNYFLSQALQIFCQFDGRRWRVKNPIQYERYMAYSPWVTPLVAAEQALLAKKNNFRANLAPNTEAAWNRILDKMCSKLKLPKYIIWMYVRRLGVNLSYESIPAFSDSAEIISSKLSQLHAVKNQLGELSVRLVAPFMDKEWLESCLGQLNSQNFNQLGKSIFDFTQLIEKKVDESMKDNNEIPALPLSNMGWLMKFPAGIC